MTFYRYFPNKIELAKTLFNIVVQEAYDKFRIIMNEDTPAEVKIQKILILKFDGTIDISQEFLTDFYSGKESGLSDYVLERTNAMWQIIIGDFRIAQQKGIFRDDLNLEFFFGLTQMFTQVFNNQKFLKMFTSPQEMIMETAKLLLYGISPRK